jgi:hypothetical protein
LQVLVVMESQQTFLGRVLHTAAVVVAAHTFLMVLVAQVALAAEAQEKQEFREIIMQLAIQDLTILAEAAEAAEAFLVALNTTEEAMEDRALSFFNIQQHAPQHFLVE